MTSAAPARVLVAIPAWNEAETIGSVIDAAAAQPQVTRVVVVDDGSSDATAAVAASHGATVLSLPFNVGVGGAMRTAFRYAREHGFDAVIQVDADGQHDPAQIPVLLAAANEGAAVVIGARFAAGDDYRTGTARRLAMRMLAGTLSRIAGTRLTDTTSGFRLADRRAIALFARHYPAEYLGDTVESLVIAARAGLPVAQVPVAMRPRQGGSASQGTVTSMLYLGRAVLALTTALARRPVELPAAADAPQLVPAR